MRICIYGSATDLISEDYRNQVYNLGKKLAESGHSLVFGGGNNGVMGASARGFRAAGGEIIGIIPKFFGEKNIEETYPECTTLIHTDEMYERKRLLEEYAEAFIIAPGGIGTFDEFFAVLTNKQLGRHNKPIVVFNVNGYYDPLKELMEHAIELKFVKQNCRKIYEYFDGDRVDDMIKFIESNVNASVIDDLKDG